MKWIKLSVNFFRSPRIMAAGRDARDLYLLLLVINGEHDFGGLVPAHYVDPEYLAHALSMTAVTVTNAASRLRHVTLISSRDDGSVVITGYDETWRPTDVTAAGRAARYRERKKLATTSNQALAGVCHRDDRDVTRDDRDVTLLDQIRLDQIRSESEVPFVPPKEQKRPAKPATELAQQDLAAGSEPKRAKSKASTRAQDNDLDPRAPMRASDLGQMNDLTVALAAESGRKIEDPQAAPIASHRYRKGALAPGEGALAPDLVPSGTIVTVQDPDLRRLQEPRARGNAIDLRAQEPLKLEPQPELPRKQKRPTKAATELSHRELAAELWEVQDRLRADVMPLARTLLPIPSALALVMDRLSEGYSREDCIHVMETFADEAKKDPKQRQWFNGETNWRPQNFRRALGRGAGDAVAPSQAPLAAYHRPMEP